MQEILARILPIIALFALGYILNRLSVFNSSSADAFLKLIFYVSTPALILYSITGIELTKSYLYLAMLPVCVTAVIAIVSFILIRILKLERKKAGVFLVGTMIMNTVFTFPLIFAGLGQEGLARILLFDFGNAIIVFSLVYYIACRYGEVSKNKLAMLKKIAFSPPLWALLIAITLNLLNVKLPETASALFQTAGSITFPLVMISLGIYFTPKIANYRLLLLAIAVRMGLGMLLGLLFAYLFNLQGLDRIIALIGASAPIGYTTLTYSSLENLDKEFAASIISFSILIGFVLVPLLMM